MQQIGVSLPATEPRTRSSDWSEATITRDQLEAIDWLMTQLVRMWPGVQTTTVRVTKEVIQRECERSGWSVDAIRNAAHKLLASETYFPKPKAIIEAVGGTLGKSVGEKNPLGDHPPGSRVTDAQYRNCCMAMLTGARLGAFENQNLLDGRAVTQTDGGVPAETVQRVAARAPQQIRSEIVDAAEHVLERAGSAERRNAIYADLIHARDHGRLVREQPAVLEQWERLKAVWGAA